MKLQLPRWLNPLTNPAGLSAAAAVIYGVIQAVLNAHAHHTAVSGSVYVAAAWAILAAFTHTQVTPVRDPRLPEPVATQPVPPVTGTGTG